MTENQAITSKPKIVDVVPEQGLRYNTGKCNWSLVDFKALEPMVRVLEYGRDKYTVQLPTGEIVSGAHNWKKGLDMTKILESLARHLFALMSGEENDPESGKPHIGHILCNAMFWSHFYQKNKEG